MSHATHVFTSTHAFFCYSEGDLAEKVAGIQAVDFAPCVKHLKFAEEKNLKKSGKITKSKVAGIQAIAFVPCVKHLELAQEKIENNI